MTEKLQDKDVVTLIAVGDTCPREMDPEFAFKTPILAKAEPIIKKADIAFCQFEGTLSDKPNRKWFGAVAHPDNAKVVAAAGFNVAGVASNSHMNAGLDPFIDTLNTLKQNNLPPVGVGMNIVEARTPVIIERKGNRVAFLGYSAIIPKMEVPYDAQPDRPGCAPMYISTFYEARDWQPGTPNPNIITLANKDDLAAMQDDMRKAKTQADVVVMSIHWGVHHVPGMIAMYEYEVGHAAIDAGCDLIIGHHTHILKGIEVYKGKVIFHNLGTFAMVMANRTTKKRSWDPMFDLISPWRSPDNPTNRDPKVPMLRITPEGRKTAMAKCRIADHKIQSVSFLPFWINDVAQPEPLTHEDKKFGEIYDYAVWCTRDQNLDTQFEIVGDEVIVHT